MQSEVKYLNSKIVVIGSCSVDFTTYSPRLPFPGETVHGTKFVTSYGGKGANQCVAAAKLGAQTHMICRLGCDQWGHQYRSYLEELGVNVDHAHIMQDTTTGIAQITVAENGENHIVIVGGANKHLGTKDVEKATEVIKSADILIGQLETPLETTLKAFKLNNGITLLNAAPARTDIQHIFPYCSILCVNEYEASLLTDIEVDILSSPKAINKLLENGCNMVIITLGKKGAVYSSKCDRKVIHVFCDDVLAVDTTGAGDAFVGALATFMVTHKNYPMHQIIGAACQFATISVTKEGTQSSYPINYDAFVKKYEYMELK